MKLSELETIEQTDPQVSALIRKEYLRQTGGIELIASENYPSPAVLAAAGSILTCKYAEGYPGRRYYGGCEYIDEIERLAIERAKQLFGAEHANVQPHCGTTTNNAVYAAVLKPGDKVLGMSLSGGGHLSHCNPQGQGGRLYDAVLYGVNEETGLIDYDRVYDLAQQHRPKLIVCGASAYSRVIDFKKFREIADSVGAYLLADIAHIAGLVATGLHPSPVPYADFVTTTTHKTLRGPRAGLILCKAEYARQIDLAVFPRLQGGPLEHIIAAKAIAFKEALEPGFKQYQKHVLKNAKTFERVLTERGVRLVTGGTDNHLLLLNVSHAGKTGKEIEAALGACHITVNKNTIPGEKLSPNVASGIRIGSPAITTRGMREPEVKFIANTIADILEGANPSDYAKDVRDLALNFPLFMR